MSGQAQSSKVAWYLVQCKPRQDARALEHLARQGFECFWPCLTVESLKGGRLRQLEQPLFPGYLFIHLGMDDNWVSLRSTRGVSRIVGFSGSPCPVDDQIIDHLRVRCSQREGAPLLRPGEAVRITSGPLADMDAIFLAMDGEQRVLLLLNLLNRQQRVPVPLLDIQPLPGPKRADIPIC